MKLNLSLALKIVLLLVASPFGLLRGVKSEEKCNYREENIHPERAVTTYGSPTAFIIGSNIPRFGPYDLVDPFRKSQFFQEYILLGAGLHNDSEFHKLDPSGYAHGNVDTRIEEILLIVYDLANVLSWSKQVNLMHQNMKKNFLWGFMNSTGMVPSLTLVNTSFEKAYRFHTVKDDNIAFHLILPKLFREKKTMPAIDAVVEFPGKTGTLKSTKTMLDFQTFPLLRWKLTPRDTLSWDEVEESFDHVPMLPVTDNCSTILFSQISKIPRGERVYDVFTKCVYQERQQKITNPCLEDMFLLSTIRSLKPESPAFTTSPNHLLISIPMLYNILDDLRWINLVDVYCPTWNDTEMADEECPDPVEVVLTNQHLLIHTNKGLFVSNDLTLSTANSTIPYTIKPLVKFSLVDPCALFQTFNCTHIGAAMLVHQTIRSHRIFYSPICHIYQYPDYDDMVILAKDHVTVSPDLSEERDVFTVIFASRPYLNWNILFHSQHQYINSSGHALPIKDLLGIVYNHHRRHFDISITVLKEQNITVELDPNTNEKTNVSVTKIHVQRFILPRLDGDWLSPMYNELGAHLGNGFPDFEFPPHFYMTKLMLNPLPMDIFFLGNHLWIAEGGGPVPNLSVRGVHDMNEEESRLDSCSFNHPDRTFLCTEETHTEILVGRIGTTYNPTHIHYKQMSDFKNVMLYQRWTVSFQLMQILRGQFIAGFSGKVLLWYFFDASELVAHQEQNCGDNSKFQPRDSDDESYTLQCHVCKDIELRKTPEYNCTLDPWDSFQEFRMLAMDPAEFRHTIVPTDGPLVPFLIDGAKAIVFEADIPPLGTYRLEYTFVQSGDVGHRITCPDIRPMENDTEGDRCPEFTISYKRLACNLYLTKRESIIGNASDHEYVFLKGFRSVSHVLIEKSFPIWPVPCYVNVLIEKHSNDAVIQVDTKMFEKGKGCEFTYDHIGQTLYVPEHFSILLTGFAKYEPCSGGNVEHNKTRMIGLTTRFYLQGALIHIEPFASFLIDFRTEAYCEFYKRGLTLLKVDASCKVDKFDFIIDKYEKRLAFYDYDRNQREKHRRDLLQKPTTTTAATTSATNTTTTAATTSATNTAATTSATNTTTIAATTSATNTTNTTTTSSNTTEPEPPLFNDTYRDVEDRLLDDIVSMIRPNHKLSLSRTGIPGSSMKEMKCNKTAWGVSEGQCHLRLYLIKNPILKQSGGKISLDKHDSISFSIQLHPLSSFGRVITQDREMVITNSNPEVLSIKAKQLPWKDPQEIQIILTPTGVRKGVASVSVRPPVISTQCPFLEGSFTIIVQVHREEGRRLHVNYPVPICKQVVDEAISGINRPWKDNLPDCVTTQEILREHPVKRPSATLGHTARVFYTSLPENYRPPSSRGVFIPITKNIYNVNPALPKRRDYFRASKQTGEFKQCKGKSTKEDCLCSDGDKLSDDVNFSDCKRVTYLVKRGFRVDINVEYDRLMKDEEQVQEYFKPKMNWSITLKEVNDRADFVLSDVATEYIKQINKDFNLNQGEKHFDAKTLGITVHGTGLFHFRVTLGQMESFEKVTGYILIYSDDNDLNHVQLAVILLLTITICTMFVFVGFLIVRKRLSSQLPFKASDHEEKIKGE